MKLDSYLTPFCEILHFEGKQPRTISAYCRDIVRFFEQRDKSDPATITEQDFIEWDKQQSFQAQLKPKTRARRRASLRSFWKFLSKKHNLPDLSESIPKLPIHETDPQIVDPATLLKILFAHDLKNPIEARNQAAIAFIASTGVRREELRSINIGDVTLSANGKNYRVTVTGKGNRRRTINFGDRHREGDIATLHFAAWLFQRIQILNQERKNLDKIPLFARAPFSKEKIMTEGTVRLEGGSFNKIIANGCEKAGVPKISVHSLRHFFATECYANGMKIETVQYYMGHESIETTRRYIHIAELSRGDQARKHGPLAGLRGNPNIANLIPLAELNKIIDMTLPRAT